MATQYTTILKLALPGTGELSGTWGTTVNDNITKMVEEAVAGRAVINTWAANSHTLTTADGLTSESRCAMLEFTDTGTLLSGAGTVICPTATKIYICKNAAGQTVTIKTSAGTGVAIPDGTTMFVFCDGTNVVEAITNFDTLKVDGYTISLGGALTTGGAFTTSGAHAVTITATGTTNVTVPTTGTLATLAGTETFTNKTLTSPTISGGTVDNAVIGGSTPAAGSFTTATATTGNITTVNATTVDATNVEVTNIKAKDGTASATIADSTGVMTIASSVLTTTDINAGTIDNTPVGGSTPAAGAFTTLSSNSTTTLNGTTIPSSKTLVDTDSSQTLTNKTLSTGTAVTAGTINGAAIGGSTPAAGAFTTLSATGNTTLSGGTANGVTYLNGSKVLTSGSSLTFDGTRLTSTTGKFGSGAAANSASLMVNNVTNTATGIQLFQDGIESWIMGMPANSAGLAWSASGSEQMRLTSTGLGIGTSSPAYKLDVSGTTATTRARISATTAQADINFANTGGQLFIGVDTSSGGVTGTAYANYIYSTTATPIVFSTNTTERMRLDSAGNLGLGVTPSAWSPSGTPAKTLELKDTGGSNKTSSLASAGGDMQLSNNAYYNGSGWVYVASAQAANYYQSAGTHVWRTASSGTAGDLITFTQAMTLDASGNLSIGDAFPTGRFKSVVADSGTLQLAGAFTNNANADFQIQIKTSETHIGPSTSTPLVFVNSSNTERMRLDASGNLGIGTSSPATKLHVDTGAAGYGITIAASTQTGSTFQIGVDSNSNLAFYETYTAAQRLVLSASGNLGLGVTPSAWGSTSRAIQLAASASIEGRTNDGSHVALYSNAIWNGTNFTYQNTAAAAYYKQSSAVHSWYTAPAGTAGNAITFTQAMTLDASGNLGIGTSSPYSKLDVVQATAGYGGWKYGASLNATDFPAMRFLATTGNTGSIIGHEAGATVFLTGTTATSAGTERMRIDSAGNLGIGTSSPSEKLEVSGNIKTSAPSGGTAAAWKLGTVATVSPTSPDRTIEVEINGTIYYLAAKTTND